MARGQDTSKHPGRGVSRHKFAGGGYVDVLRSPELQRDIDNTVNMVFKTRHEGKQVRRNDGGAEQPPNLDEYPRGR